MDLLDDDLLKILDFWSFWEASPPEAVPRRLNLPAVLDPELALVIQGVRRCGKSTLLGQLVGRYQLNPAHCAFVNFEDPRLIPHLGTALLFRILDAFQSKYPQAQDLTFFFDEIQNVPQWESFLHTQLERPRHRFVVTGSNACLLSGELSTKLTGRHRVAELYPFDFIEIQEVRPKHELKAYLTEGGFPKVVLEDGDLALRQRYFRDIVERDISNRVGARDHAPVARVVQMVFESCGSEMSLRRIAGSNGVSTDTASAYLRAAEDAYLLFSCPYFTYSSRKQAVRNRKYYPVDPGLRQAVVSSSAPNLGSALEGVAFLALKKRFGQVFYWREKGEIDFVVEFDGRPLPIQVTWETPQPRHLEALEEFYQAYPRSREVIFLNCRDLDNDFDKLDF